MLIILALRSPRLGKRESWSICVSCICMFISHAFFFFFFFFFPLDVAGWLRIVIVALPGVFINFLHVPT